MPEVVKLAPPDEDHMVRAKVFGLGSAGCNMIAGIPFPKVAVSTSGTDLERTSSDRSVLIGQDRLVGIYSSDKEVVKHLPSVAGHEVVDVFNNTDLAFLMCGLGGVSGSLGAMVFSEVAQARNALDIVLAATPFSAESARRRDFAARILGELRGTSTLCIDFGNDQLSTLAPHMPMSRAFQLMNGIMTRPVIDICAALPKAEVPSLRRTIGGASAGSFGLGMGRGDERVERCVSEAFSSPWFSFDMFQVQCAIAVYSSADPWDREMERVVSLVGSRLPSASLVFGSYADPSLGDRIRLSLVLCRRA
jgi:cell division protein FtsZ